MLGLQKKRFCHSAQNSVLFRGSRVCKSSPHLTRHQQILPCLCCVHTTWAKSDGLWSFFSGNLLCESTNWHLSLVAVWCSKSFFHCCNNGVKHQPSHASVFSHITHKKSPGMVGEDGCVSVGGRARLTPFCMFLQAVLIEHEPEVWNQSIKISSNFSVTFTFLDFRCLKLFKYPFVSLSSTGWESCSNKL